MDHEKCGMSLRTGPFGGSIVERTGSLVKSWILGQNVLHPGAFLTKDRIFDQRNPEVARGLEPG